MEKTPKIVLYACSEKGDGRVMQVGKVNSVGDRFEDAVFDLCNYAHLLLAYEKEKK